MVTRFHKNIRLPDYDYSSPGAYFVTIVTTGRSCCLGEIADARTVLTAVGDIVREQWEGIAQRDSCVELDDYVIMPNHVHGIIRIGNGEGIGTKRRPLGTLVGAFKTLSTREINRLRGTPGRKLWQDGFYDHVIRGENDLSDVREYIRDNPLKWELDAENPDYLRRVKPRATGG